MSTYRSVCLPESFLVGGSVGASVVGSVVGSVDGPKDLQLQIKKIQH